MDILSIGHVVSGEFFQQDTETLALSLLNTVLVHDSEEGMTAGRIVEVEMYRGMRDKAAHSYGGMTPRTRVMFGPPGMAYVYLIYGIHYCFNVVAGPEGEGEAILVRALEPLAGLPLMAARRALKKEGHASYLMTNGPAKLAQAMGIDKHFYGTSLIESPLRLHHLTTGQVGVDGIWRGPRINIGYADEAQYFPWRFWIEGNPFVSLTKKHP